MSVRVDAAADALRRTTNLPSVTGFTMMGWFMRIGTSTTFPAILQLGETTGGDNYSIELQSGSSFAINFWNGASDFVSATLMTTNTWFHLALVVSGNGSGQAKLYINGVPESAADGNAAVAAQQFGILCDVTSVDTNWLNGRGAAVKVWDAVLTDAEILQEMRQYLPVRTANINAFYPLFTAAEAASDFSGQGNDLTLSGTLTTEDGPPIPWKSARQRYFFALVSSGQTLSAGNQSVIFTNPAVAFALGAVGINAGNQSVIFTNPAVAIAAALSLLAGNQSVLFTNLDGVLSAGALNLAAGLQSIIFSFNDAAVTQPGTPQTIAAGNQSTVFTNPAALINAVAVLLANGQTVVFTNPSVGIGLGVALIPTGNQIILLTNPTANLDGGAVVEIKSNDWWLLR